MGGAGEAGPPTCEGGYNGDPDWMKKHCVRYFTTGEDPTHISDEQHFRNKEKNVTV